MYSHPKRQNHNFNITTNSYFVLKAKILLKSKFIFFVIRNLINYFCLLFLKDGMRLISHQIDVQLIMILDE